MKMFDDYEKAALGVICLAVVVFAACLIWFFNQPTIELERNSLTCYNSAFEISYMSPPNAVIGSRPSQYGVWTLEDGTYVQNSGETCIVEKAQVEVQK